MAVIDQLYRVFPLIADQESDQLAYDQLDSEGVSRFNTRSLMAG